jgi:glycosyltransferase 2 family protein
MLRHSTWAGWLLRIFFTVVVLSLLITRIDFASTMSSLRAVQPGYLLAALILYFAYRFLWGYLMSFALIPLRLDFTILQLFKINLIAGFYAVVLPGTMLAGGAVSWYKLARPSGKPFEAGSLVVYFRLVHTLTLLAIGLVGMWFDSHLLPDLRLKAAILLVGVMLLLLPFVSPAFTHLAEGMGRTVSRRLIIPGRLRDKGLAIWGPLIALQALRGWTIVFVLGLSLVSNLLGILVWFVLARAVGIQLSIFVIGWIAALLFILQMIPVSVAGLGVREASLVLLLGRYGVPEVQALGFSLAIFASMVLVAMVGGLLEGIDVIRGRQHGPTEADAETNAITRQSAT